MTHGLTHMKTLLYFMAIFLLLSGLAEAQSTLEYATLTETVAAAAKVKKEKIQNQSQEESQASSWGTSNVASGMMTKLYGESGQAMSSKAGSLLGQLGSPTLPKQTNSENKDSMITNTNPVQNETPSNAQTDSTVKIYLKNGRIIQGKLVEQKDDHLKVDLEGVTVTFFKEEIDRIEKEPR